MKILLALDNPRQASNLKHFLQHFSLPGKKDLYLIHVIAPQQWALRRGVKMTPRLRQKIEATKVQLRKQSEEFLRRETKSFASEEVRCHSLVVEGIPGAEILDAIKKTGAELVILGTRGLSGLQRFLLGSVSEWILEDAPCSVLIVRGVRAQKSRTPRGVKILVATDGSADAQAAIEFVQSLTLPASSHITLLHVVRKHRFQTEQLITSSRVGSMDFPRIAEELLQERGREGAKLLKETRTKLKKTGVKIAEHLAFGHEVDQILKAMKRTRANLIVMGSRGITGLRRALLGSVSQKVARHASCPVLVIRRKGKMKS